MKPCVSPFSTARATRVIGRWPTRSAPPARARLGLGHAGAAERRIDVERVGGDAVADPARLVVEQVRGDDLVVVVGGVGEGAAAVAIAERPDARHAGAQPIVDDDVAARVDATPAWSRPRSSVFGRRPTASSTCEPTTSGAPPVQSTPRGDARRRACRERDAFGVEADLDALALEDLLDRRRDVLVLARRRGAAPSRRPSPRCRSGGTSARTRARCSCRRRHEMPRQRIDVHASSCWSDRRPRSSPACPAPARGRRR